MALIQAQTRDGIGTGTARHLRRNARIPAVLYGGAKNNRNLSIDLKDWIKLLDTEGTALRTHHQDMMIDGTLRVAVLMRDYQIHPVTGLPLHVDFMRFDPNQIIHVKVPVHLVGETKSPGVKAGGVVELIQKELEVHCRADDLPNFIEISIAELNIGASIHIKQVALPKGVEITAEDNFTVVTIVGTRGTAEDDNQEGA
ncbi:MAG: 50S ribosomal protein L25/general stress protein Ctc [Magnetococcus sp. YQC-5]